MPGGQLAIVHYAPDHDPTDEWVYNSADIDTSKIIWARDMGPAQNLNLIHYYKNRTPWLIQPDSSFEEITPYSPQAIPNIGKAGSSEPLTRKNPAGTHQR